MRIRVQFSGMKTADKISSVLAALAQLSLAVYFFATAEYSGAIQFRRIIAPSTGEPVSIVMSLFLYILLGWLLWLVIGLGVGMLVSWPVGMVYAMFFEPPSEKSRSSIGEDGLAGVGVSAILFIAVLLICGGSIVFGMVVV